jgi:hypothetical protein
MANRTKSVKKGRKRTQKGGFWNSLKKSMGFSGGDETQLPPSQNNGIFGSVTNFFGSVAQKSEDLLTQGQNKLQEGLSIASEKVNEGRESLGKAISGSSDQTSMAANQNQIAADQNQIAADQNQMAADQNQIAADQNQMSAYQNGSQSVGGRRKKNLKGGNRLAYHASPVQGLKVAKPTYWMSGGKRRSHKKRKNSKKLRMTRNKRR